MSLIGPFLGGGAGPPGAPSAGGLGQFASLFASAAAPPPSGAGETKADNVAKAAAVAQTLMQTFGNNDGGGGGAGAPFTQLLGLGSALNSPPQVEPQREPPPQHSQKGLYAFDPSPNVYRQPKTTSNPFSSFIFQLEI